MKNMIMSFMRMPRSKNNNNTDIHSRLVVAFPPKSLPFSGRHSSDVYFLFCCVFGNIFHDFVRLAWTLLAAHPAFACRQNPGEIYQEFPRCLLVICLLYYGQREAVSNTSHNNNRRQQATNYHTFQPANAAKRL